MGPFQIRGGVKQDMAVGILVLVASGTAANVPLMWLVELNI